MKSPQVINIQRYSIHDGPGTRTSIFFKGCHLSCAWCHNPESQRYDREIMYNEERCTGCGACIRACPSGAIMPKGLLTELDRNACKACGNCVEVCPTGAREIVGKSYSVDELVKEVEKDRIFYEESGGGVTLSGGEVMSQPKEFIVELARKLQRRGTPVVIDTCGEAPWENYEAIAPYVDIFMYDIKVIDNDIHKKYMGLGNARILENLRKLSQKDNTLWIRIPLIEPVNTDDTAIGQMITFMKSLRHIEQVNLLPYHNTGSSKYEKLQRPYPGKDLRTPSPQRMEQIQKMFTDNGFKNVKIGG